MRTSTSKEDVKIEKATINTNKSRQHYELFNEPNRPSKNKLNLSD